ncbi:dihydrofolate reductase [Magnetovirga frankeli]|uniref:dihydrofolate reductase n=1 Tax=Magnetovirga frankeli TaxID=947516 RepID=UPI0012937A12|nr:dihydrofolate reductase [gamma proteobacterium SS-5]
MNPAPLSLIAAMADNRVIGRDNRLPWHLPADLAHFKRLTLGKPLLMGRKTWESLPGLLPGRPHLVISRNPAYQAPGARCFTDLNQALAAIQAEEIMVVGGAEIYAQTLPLAQRLYLTLVHMQAEGDCRFPAFDADNWRLIERQDHAADVKNPYAYSFLHYSRHAA